MLRPALLLLLLYVPMAHAEHDHEVLFNKVSLQAEARAEVPNDEMTVLMTVEHQGAEPSVLAERVNRDMAWALEQTKKQSGVQTETRGYATEPDYRDGVISGWRVRQNLQLKSREFTTLTELLGVLQERLQIVHMRFNPAPETRQAHQDRLISEAMERFKQRVAIIRTSMDDRDYRIVDLTVNTDGSGYPPMFMAADTALEAKAQRAAPVVEGGTSELTVTVSGSVQFY